ncbi:MAG TPA: YfiR family protein, partial [Polyangia bacterium]|nr:YfiR family protein [Polyangia bacterium]
DEQLEYAIKAEVIERFTHFIDWPNEAFAGANAPFTICVVGDSPLTPHLQFVLARDHRIDERHAELRRLKPDGDVSGCQVAFIAASERPRLKQLLARTTGHPILTVGDSDGFAHEGVLINLYLDEGNHVRFEICADGVKKSGLKLSAQLLRFARVVTGSSP